MNLEDLLQRPAGDLALILGNGINQFSGTPSTSWKALLQRLIKKHLPALRPPTMGTGPAELFDILGLASSAEVSELQRDFCAFMQTWRPEAQHRRIMGWAEKRRAPVLTTNFDELLSQAAACKFCGPADLHFTDWYPWDCRFAHELVDDPCSAFGIWHINGMTRYRRSIRLGLTHYIGSAQRAREWLYRGGNNRLFSGKSAAHWRGRQTWMHVVFNMPLLIVGLGLEENEVFLRWLLIERAKYFRQFPSRRHDAWYVYSDEDPPADGKRFFLRGIGIEPVRARNFDEIYLNPGWEKH